MGKNMNRGEMLEFLQDVQGYFCAYQRFDKKGPSNVKCDCKFGADLFGGRSEKGNGCPEMRGVLAVFAGMTGTEFNRIQTRINKRGQAWLKKQMVQKMRREMLIVFATKEGVTTQALRVKHGTDLINFEDEGFKKIFSLENIEDDGSEKVFSPIAVCKGSFCEQYCQWCNDLKEAIRNRTKVPW